MSGGHGILGFTLVTPQNCPCLELLQGLVWLQFPHSWVAQSTLHTHHKSQNPTEPSHGWAWKAPLELILSHLPAQAGSWGQITSKYPLGRWHSTGYMTHGSGETHRQHLGQNEGGEFASESTFFHNFFLQNRQHFPQEKGNKGIYRIQHSTLFLTSGTVCTGELSCYHTDFGSRSWQGCRGSSIGKSEENLVQNLPIA